MLSEKQKDLIESFGVIQEQMGLTPAAARVNALLTISEELHLSFDQIKEALHLSKSATSNAINMLLTLNRIGYKTKPGDRKRYFYSKLDQWKELFKKDMQGLNHYRDILSEIIKNRSTKNEDFNNQLKDLNEFMEYFIRESIKLIDNWKK
ncbi:transcriptional regulator [Tenacibaculum todarodis]|uniref:Transcriptional regulator n=1 Tax=Tenacibaculum todarodis TaxID=1850252 RepID=A0A1L3JFT1_9FLAO|nr:transcriptional regulator [Tenacibaculum todarodis]APG63980.1 transcriptional regulator [Tenacibaculum todarodis]